MQMKRFQDCRSRISTAGAAWSRLRLNRARFFACIATAVVFGSAAVTGQQTPSPNPDKPYLLPEANRLPDANQQMEMRDQKTKAQNYAAANAERKKQISDDTAKLLKMATDLKTEVDKTDKDTLSLNVIRKAEEIERLAHNVREKMKLTVGPG